MDDRRALMFALDMPAEPVSVAMARELVVCLGEKFGSDKLYEAEVVVSELVTNAIRHGVADRSERVCLRLSALDGQIHGEVDDRGQPFEPRQEDPVPDAVGGFGLHIVDKLVRHWEIQRHDGGNRIVFSI